MKPGGLATVNFSTPLGKLRTFALYCQSSLDLYNGPYSKADWGGRWGCVLKTEVLQQPHGELLYYIARPSAI
jgi:hypothetical protein